MSVFSLDTARQREAILRGVMSQPVQAGQMRPDTRVVLHELAAQLLDEHVAALSRIDAQQTEERAIAAEARLEVVAPGSTLDAVTALRELARYRRDLLQRIAVRFDFERYHDLPEAIDELKAALTTKDAEAVRERTCQWTESIDTDAHPLDNYRLTAPCCGEVMSESLDTEHPWEFCPWCGGKIALSPTTPRMLPDKSAATFKPITVWATHPPEESVAVHYLHATKARAEHVAMDQEMWLSARPYVLLSRTLLPEQFEQMARAIYMERFAISTGVRLSAEEQEEAWADPVNDQYEEAYSLAVLAWQALVAP